MAFKPVVTQSSTPREYEQRNYPTPKAGSRPARVSLIVDLGVQKREPFEDPKTKETKPQDPCHQVAVFADLTKDVVDYGGDIGMQQYRLLLNKTFMGVPQGINFFTTSPKDADGNVLKNKPWGLHPASLLTKLFKVVGLEDKVYEPSPRAGVDIEPLLGQAFMADVEVKKTTSKDKTGTDGKPLEYTNVNFKAAAPVPEDYPIPELTATPKIISFTDATPEDVQLIRAGLLKIIKQAINYPGSQMQKAVEAWEANKPAKNEQTPKEEEKPQPNANMKPSSSNDDVPF